MPRRGLHRSLSLRVAAAGSPSLGPIPRHVHGRRRHGRRGRSHRQRSAVPDRSRRLVMEVYRDRPRDEWRMNRRELVDGERSARHGGTRRGGSGAEPWAGVPQGSTRRSHALLRRGTRRGRGVLPRGARVRQSRLEFSRRAVPLGRRLSPPRRHEHLGGWRAARVTGTMPGSIRGSLVVPDRGDVCATRCAASRAPASPRARSIAALPPPIRGALVVHVTTSG